MHPFLEVGGLTINTHIFLSYDTLGAGLLLKMVPNLNLYRMQQQGDLLEPRADMI